MGNFFSLMASVAGVSTFLLMIFSAFEIVGRAEYDNVDRIILIILGVIVTGIFNNIGEKVKKTNG
jgi:hypothetical protein